MARGGSCEYKNGRHSCTPSCRFGERTSTHAFYFLLIPLDDEANVIVLPGEYPIPAKTTWTLLIYLTGATTGCVGGQTVFYPELGPAKNFSEQPREGTEPIIVDLEVGMALLHKHGNDCLLHEGRKVTDGEKWVIRSDLCVRR